VYRPPILLKKNYHMVMWSGKLQRNSWISTRIEGAFHCGKKNFEVLVNRHKRLNFLSGKTDS